jgi:hypothetical protein
MDDYPAYQIRFKPEGSVAPVNPGSDPFKLDPSGGIRGSHRLAVTVPGGIVTLDLTHGPETPVTKPNLIIDITHEATGGKPLTFASASRKRAKKPAAGRKRAAAKKGAAKKKAPAKAAKKTGGRKTSKRR